MTVGSATLLLFLFRKKHHFSLLHLCRESSTDEYLAVSSLAVGGRIYISNIAIRRIGCNNAVRLTENDSGGYRHCLFQVCIRDYGFIEVRTRIQSNHTRLYHIRITADYQRIKFQFHRETQRTIIKDFLRAITVWIDDRVALHQSSRTATQRRTYGITVHSITVIDMIGNGSLQFRSRFRICFSQFSYLGTLFLIEFFSVHTFKNWLCGIVLRKKVIAKATFTSCLQCRTISTVTAQVILPCNVVQTFGIIFAAGNYVERFRSARLDSISGCTIRFHRNRENNLLIIRHLIRNLLSVYVKHHNLRCIGQLQLGNDIAHRHFNHLSRTL